MSIQNLHRHWSKKFLHRPELDLFGLAAVGRGTIIGCGKKVVGIARRIRALFGFRITMSVKMEVHRVFIRGGWR